VWEEVVMSLSEPRRRLSFGLACSLASLATAGLPAFSAGQVTKTWTNSTSASHLFHSSTNWSPAGAPGASDTSRFNDVGTYDVLWNDLTGNTTNAAVEVRAGNVSFVSEGGAARTHAVASALVDAGRLNLNAGLTLRSTSSNAINLTSGGRLDVNAGATFTATNAALNLGSIGNATENRLAIDNGTVNALSSNIGEAAGSAGRATINDPQGRWNMSRDLIVGGSGAGVLNISGGAQVGSTTGTVGRSPGSSGAVSIADSGSLWSNRGDLNIVGSATSVTIGAGSRFNVGPTAPVIPADGYSHVDTTYPYFDTSYNPLAGRLTVTGGASLTNNSLGLKIAAGGGGNGRITVTGAGTTVNAGDFSYIGSNGTGFLGVGSGGRYITNLDTIFGNPLPSSTAKGNALVSGLNSLLWSKRNVEVHNGGIKLDPGIPSGNGSVLIGDAPLPRYSFDISDNDPISANAGGSLLITNGGGIASHLPFKLASGAGQSGRVRITGAGSQSFLDSMYVGLRGTGDARIEAGATINSSQGIWLGFNATGVGTMTVTGVGSTASGRQLSVGPLGAGTLDITSGGKVTVSGNATVGGSATGVGTINVEGTNSLLSITGNLVLGDPAAAGGRGTIHIKPGGTVSAASLFIDTTTSRIVLARAGNLSGAMIIDYPTTGPSPANTIRAYLQTGFNNGDWLGNGIRADASVLADARMTIGYSDNATTTLLTLKPTLKGDTNLDHTVSFDDLLALAANYNQSNRLWFQGDFDYDGSVSFSDLLILAATYNQSLTGDLSNSPTGTFAGDWALAQQLAVPEPTTIACLIGAPLTLLTRRRRRA
jgi:T5SS/PEP-CTERM-associated repeat protein